MMGKTKLFSDCEYDKHHAGLNWKVWQSYRKAVIRRNHNKCVKCGSFCDLEMHHIKNYAEFPELRLDLNNGVPFCSDCHELFHVTYGYVGNNRRQLEQFLGRKNFKRCRIFD